MEFGKAMRSLLVLGAVASASCARIGDVSTNELAGPAFEAWMHINHSDDVIDTTAFGVYIIEDVPGSGEEVVDGNYVYMDYTVRTAGDGVITASSYEQVARKLGTYKQGNYYGPMVQQYAEGVMMRGVRDIFAGGRLGPMKVGGKRTAIIPGWLLSTEKYSTGKDYPKNVSGSACIYTIELVDQASDIVEWQISRIKEYIASRGVTADTTSGHGFFYCRTADPVTDRKLSADTTVYVNYIGRRLDGAVFDTSIEDTAKVWGIYDATRSYGPTSIKTAADSTAFTMGSSASSVVKGFSLTIYNMHPFESGFGAFTSDFGYSSTGSGSSIPGYSPLVFEIDMVAKPKQ